MYRQCVVGIGRLPCRSICLIGWVLLLFFHYYCCVLARDAWLMQMYQDTILHNITSIRMSVAGCWLSSLAFTHSHPCTLAIPKCVNKVQFLSSFLSCPNSVRNLNAIGLYCIAVFSSRLHRFVISFHALKCFACFFALSLASLLHRRHHRHHHDDQYMCLCASFEWQDSRSFRKSTYKY